MDGLPSMLAKPADMLPPEFWSIKRKILLWVKIEAIYIKKLKTQLNTCDDYRGWESTL